MTDQTKQDQTKQDGSNTSAVSAPAARKKDYFEAGLPQSLKPKQATQDESRTPTKLEIMVFHKDMKVFENFIRFCLAEGVEKNKDKVITIVFEELIAGIRSRPRFKTWVKENIDNKNQGQSS